MAYYPILQLPSSSTDITAEDIPMSSSDDTSVKYAIDDTTPVISTQTVDDVNWTIIKTGIFYEMYADITITNTSPVQWGGLYVYRNSAKPTYLLPIALTKKICDYSFTNGSVGTLLGLYSDVSGNENSFTSADVLRPTTTNNPIVVHKYIKGYVTT